ncbi:MAG TPA: DNA gyrase subunit A [Spirochaetia bacterium]|nr:DNA gyrase subunit A [Spirochaetia bacterium]
MPDQAEKIVPVNIEEEMKKSYLDYAMSVIVGRALPDVRDGLKPVHRRILYAMHQVGMTADKPHRKSAHIVGEVMSKFHPHGDVAIYDALVRMAQDFSSRYMQVDGHGNFGSVDGDAPAAMRYTEARMSRLAGELLADIDKDTVDFIPNYDASDEEPVILPSRVPNLLINGSDGIAVGMATKIPPHNLGEVIDALQLLIGSPEASIEEIMGCIKGPDFPTAGRIMGTKGIEAAYTTGRGSIKVRAETFTETLAGGRQAIIVKEIPFQVNKARLVEKIAELVKEKKVDGISDLRDESDRRGMRIVIELKRDAKVPILLNQLYKHTQMQDTFGVIMLALVDNQPRVLNLKEVLYYYLEHQKEVVIRRTRYELNRAEARAHILEGLRIALDHLDEVINTIRSSHTVDEARQKLMDNFALSELQAVAILDMRLQRLTGLEREKIEAEYAELLEKIRYLREVLASEEKIMGIISGELAEMRKKYADARRTRITDEEAGLVDEDLIPEEDMVITITNEGYVKRAPLNTYRNQKRGGRGVTAMSTKETDFLRHLFVASTHHHFLFFTNLGKVHRLKVHEIPEFSRQAKGTALVNLLNVAQNEKVTTVIPVREFKEDQFLLMVTTRGQVKKTSLNEYDTSRRDGIIAISLVEGDELVDVKLTGGQEEMVIVSHRGLAVRFAEDQVRPMGRTARGVRGIGLREDDLVVGMEVVRPAADLLMVSVHGYGKRTAMGRFPAHSRGGKGVIAMKTTDRNGVIASILAVRAEEEVMIITQSGLVIRIKAGEISRLGRAAAGVRLMKMSEGDAVVAMARVIVEED